MGGGGNTKKKRFLPFRVDSVIETLVAFQQRSFVWPILQRSPRGRVYSALALIARSLFRDPRDDEATFRGKQRLEKVFGQTFFLFLSSKQTKSSSKQARGYCDDKAR